MAISRKIWLLGALVVGGLILGVSANTAGNNKHTLKPLAIDWKALEFTCTQEKNLLPKPDPEAEQWFQESRRLYKTHPPGNDIFEKQILKLTLQAAERNHAKALNNLVVMYSQADGVDADEAKAVDYAERLIKMNVGMGYYHMGVFLEQGIGVEHDRKAALVYFRKSADLGNAQGQLVVGKKMVNEFLMTPMRDKAIAIGVKMLECSLAQGHAPAGHELGMHYAISEPDIEKSLTYFQKAAALGDSASMFNLHKIFEEGKYGIPKDPQRGACYKKLDEILDADKTKRFPNIDTLCPLPPGEIHAPESLAINASTQQGAASVSHALPVSPDATTNPLKRTMRFVLGAYFGEPAGQKSHYAGEPFKLYADGALLEKGLADKDGAFIWEHKEGTQQYQVKLATGQVFNIDVLATFAADKDVRNRQKLANRGYRDYQHDAGDKAPHGAEGEDFRLSLSANASGKLLPTLKASISRVPVQNIDWQNLEFTCVHEKDLWPKPDLKAEQWYQEADRLYEVHPPGSGLFEKKILKLLLQAAERNHLQALNELVVMYSQADGVDFDAAKAVEYAERLVKKNIGVGYFHLGTFLDQGFGVDPNPEDALAYFRKAADLGNMYGQTVVGDKLIHDFLRTPKESKAVEIGKKMLDCALAQGYAEAGEKLGYFYGEKKNTDLSLQYFQKAGALGQINSLFKLSLIFENGDYGAQKDPQRAACYYKLRDELSADKTKRFPNIDKLCPLPPKPMPKSPA